MSKVATTHLSGYQERDYEVVDYRMAELTHTGLRFRGPVEVDSRVGYFACIGAAQTFGCFVDRPYPTLLSNQLGLPVLNLGYGGAGPEFFADQTSLHAYLNQASFVVLQVMSGRSQSNSLYECGGLEYATRRSDGRRMGAQRAIAEAMLPGPAHLAGKRIPSRLRRLLPDSEAAVRSRTEPLISEIREAWVESHRRLLARLTAPVVLFWFSKRSTDYGQTYSDVAGVFGQFPQMVNTEMIDAIRPLCHSYVECISERGSPQPLKSRFTGEPVEVDPANDRADLGFGTWTHNRYYPSPEMHEDAAESLASSCSGLLGHSE